MCYYELDMTNISSDAYGKFLASYKTSDASIKAKIELVFLDATTQTVLAEDSHTTWKRTATVNITATKTIDKIRIYANAATGDVYFDWLIIRTGQFEFPHVGSGGVHVSFPMNVPEFGVGGRYGGELQNLGMHAVQITVSGNVLSGEAGWDSGSGPTFEYLLDALHKDEWNWFTCDYPDISCKVMVKQFDVWNDVTERKATTRYKLDLLMYSRSSLDLDTWGDKEWLGYE